MAGPPFREPDYPSEPGLLSWKDRLFRKREQGKDAPEMLKLAFYGKGGIGKSTIVSSLACAFARSGWTVMQIGCDPKADSTVSHCQGERIPTVLDLVRARGDSFSLDEMVRKGTDGVICAEAGGPVPGMGCAGRGIIAALEALERKGAYREYRPDIVLYDVLGDVVCGGFAMPMRKGYADAVCIVTSGENMSIHAAGGIALAVKNFQGRGYASLGGFVLNRRNVADEEEKVRALAADFESEILGDLPWSPEIQEAERRNTTAVSAFPESGISHRIRELADRLLQKEGEWLKC